jgi:hypothetical protein
MTIWFDMDGTIADLYGVDGWLDYLKAENTFPYELAKPLVNLSHLARLLHKAQEKGYEIGIISWTSKGGSDLYNGAVALAKLLWLHKHLPSVEWDNIKIVAYGTNKRTACGGGVLFDDEIGNREAWGAGAYDPAEIIRVLKGI